MLYSRAQPPLQPRLMCHAARAHQFALKRAGEEAGHPVGKISFIDLAGSERGADTYDNNRCVRPFGSL